MDNQKQTTPEPIYSVQMIADLVRLRTQPPTLYMRVSGNTATTGWSGAALMPRIYVNPPTDGIQEFDFVAVPPTGFVLQAITPVSAEVTAQLSDWARGVRVVAANNDVEQLFPVILEPMMEGAFSDSEDADLSFLSSEEMVISNESLLIEGLEESGFTAFRKDQTCSEFLLISANIPETKTEWEMRCIIKDPFSGKCKVKTKVPIIYKRNSKLRLIARVCYPSGKAIEGNLKDCVLQAIAAGVAVGVITSGNLAAAAAALKAYLVACLEAKIGEAIEDIAVDIRREQIPGQWKKI